ncbi:hypothetical protein Hte_002668 [Hypoxylon texense]
MNSKPDFVVVGGGLAGLVVVTRLTENPETTVVVLEAGQDHSADPRIRTPAFWPSLMILTGTTGAPRSAINGQAFVANSKAAVDAWTEFGSPGWDWETLAPYYRKFYTLTRPSCAACDHLRLSYIGDEVRGTHGLVQARFPEEVEDPPPTARIDTLATLGYSASSDPFSGEMVGGVAGVHVRKDGNVTTVEPTKEVILAAGVSGTPKLLELSGIGSRECLEPLGISVVVENLNVGENLQDHPNTSISLEVADGVKTMDALSRQEPEALGAAMQEYMTKKTGPFASGRNFAGSLLPLPDFEGPDGQETLKEVLLAADEDATPGPFSPYHSSFVHRVLGDPTEGIGNLFTYASCSNVIPEGAGADIIHHGAQGTPGNFLTICAALLYSLSRGNVHIASADPAAKPTIDPRYLEHPLDLEVIARFPQYIEKIAQTEPLSKYLKPEGRRNHGAPMDPSDLGTAKEYVKKSGLSCWHPTSLCAMLPMERGGVVSTELLVYGVEGLRIADSSVVPPATRGNCHGIHTR